MVLTYESKKITLSPTQRLYIVECISKAVNSYQQLHGWHVNLSNSQFISTINGRSARERLVAIIEILNTLKDKLEANSDIIEVKDVDLINMINSIELDYTMIIIDIRNSGKKAEEDDTCIFINDLLEKLYGGLNEGMLCRKKV